MSEIDDGMDNETEEKKTVIYLTTDEVVGLIMEWAESVSLPEWMEKRIKDLQHKYDSIDNQPTEEEKIRFIYAFSYEIPHGSFVSDIVLRFLKNYDSDWVICKGS
jgi:hypothetical protein